MINEAKEKMQASMVHLKGELAKLHTGRANPGLIEDIQVEAYGSHMRLMEVATITAPQSNLLVIQPWDKTVLPAVVKAIEAANIGLQPKEDGDVIRIAIPPLSQERREQLVKLMNSQLEEARVAVRAIRHEEREAILRAEKAGDVSEDESERMQKDLQKATDDAIEAIEKIGKAKEAELLEI